MLKKNEILSPRFYYKNGSLYVIYKSIIFNQFDSFVDGFVYLYGFYFCFDLVYPQCYKQVLGLFHSFLFSNLKNAEITRNLGYINITSNLAEKL